MSLDSLPGFWAIEISAFSCHAMYILY
jgi:hypothetical protein